MINIKRLRPDDYDIARELFLFFQVDDAISPPSIPSDFYLKRILKKDDFHVLVAYNNEDIIGGLTAYELMMYKMNGVRMFLYEIGVMPHHRKKGIAKELIRHLLLLCRERGIGELFVATNRSNTAAINLYEATGGTAESDSILFIYDVVNNTI